LVTNFGVGLDLAHEMSRSYYHFQVPDFVNISTQNTPVTWV